MHHENNSRSLAKTVTWRVFAVIVTFLTVYAFTANAKLASGATVVRELAAIILYYFHERIWNRFHWGRIMLSRDK